jgi:type II secretory pathway pseudopilin PulG
MPIARVAMAVLRRRDLPLEAGSDASFETQPAPSRPATVLLRLVRTVARRERGFSMVEIVIALMLFEFVAAGIVGLLTSSSAATTLARQRTLAQQAALGQIESIRSLDYSVVGLVNGNPPGSVAATANVSTGGLSATVTTQISYVDDPTPLSYTSHANYKRVTVTVRRTSDSRQLAQEVTYVAPPVKSFATNATVNAQILDYGNNTPVQNVGVALSTGPSAPRNDVSDAGGNVPFAGLTPNPTNGAQAYYDLTLTPPTGYVALADTVSPAGAAHVQLSPGQTWSTVLYLYRPSTIYVQLLNADATAFAGIGTVTVSYTRNATNYQQVFSYAGTTLSVTSINGVPLIPSVTYTVSFSAAGFYPNPPGSTSASATVPTSYPTDLTRTFAFNGAQLASANVTVKGNNGNNCANASVTVSGGPWSVTLNAATDAVGAPAAYTNTIPVGTGYTVKGTKSGFSGQLTSQTIAAGTNPFTITIPGTPC